MTTQKTPRSAGSSLPQYSTLPSWEEGVLRAEQFARFEAEPTDSHPVAATFFPFGKIPEYKFCGVRVEPAVRVAAE
jgi:hypothetical protein